MILWMRNSFLRSHIIDRTIPNCNCPCIHANVGVMASAHSDHSCFTCSNSSAKTERQHSRRRIEARAMLPLRIIIRTCVQAESYSCHCRDPCDSKNTYQFRRKSSMIPSAFHARLLSSVDNKHSPSALEKSLPFSGAFTFLRLFNLGYNHTHATGDL